MELTLGGAAALAAGALWRWSPGWAAALSLFALLAVFARLGLSRFSLLAALSLSLLFLAGHHSSISPPAEGIEFGKTLRYRGEVVEDPAIVAGGARVLVRLSGVAPPEPDGGWSPASGTVSLTLEVREGEPFPSGGDRVVFRTALAEPFGFRNPGTLWKEFYAARKGISARGRAAVGSTALLARPAPGEAPFADFRRGMSEAIRRAAPGPSGASIASITLGDRSGIDRATNDLFVRTGTIHLLSVSGLHLSIVMLLSMALLRLALARFPRLALAHPVKPLARVGALIPVGAYAAVAGFGPATLRSLLMLALVAAAGALSRRLSTLSVLSATLLAILLSSPLSIADPGLQLSFAAIVGLFWLCPALLPVKKAAPQPLIPPPRWRLLLGRCAWVLASLAAASAAATLMTAPLASFHFGQGGWSGIVFNLAAVPVSGFVTLPISLAGALAYPICEPLAVLLWKGAGLSMEFLFRIFSLADLPDSGRFSWPFATVWGVIGAYALLLALAARGMGRRVRLAAAALGALLLLLPPAGGWAWARLEGRSHFHLFDVGDGLASAFSFPGGSWVAVDGGGVPGSFFDVGGESVWPALAALGCARLDLVVSTHPHPDHLTGLVTLVRRGRPSEVIAPLAFKGDERYRALLEAASEVGAAVAWAGPGRESRLFGPVTLTLIPGGGREENDRSLMVEAASGPTRVLIGADVGREEQVRLLGSGALAGRVAVWVAAHHGLANAVSGEFFDALSPAWTLVSCGAHWGGPSEALLTEAARVGSRVETTRDSGALSVAFDSSGAVCVPSPR